MTSAEVSGDRSSAHTGYVRTETVISLIVTVVLSCAFAVFVFGRSTPIVASDPRLRIDAALQALIVAFLGSLVPALIARRRLRASSLRGVDRAHSWPVSPVVRSLAITLVVALPMAAAHETVAAMLSSTALNLPPLLAYKACFGVAVALLATPLAVAPALRGDNPLGSGRF